MDRAENLLGRSVDVMAPFMGSPHEDDCGPMDSYEAYMGYEDGPIVKAGVPTFQGPSLTPQNLEPVHQPNLMQMNTPQHTPMNVSMNVNLNEHISPHQMHPPHPIEHINTPYMTPNDHGGVQGAADHTKPMTPNHYSFPPSAINHAGGHPQYYPPFNPDTPLHPIQAGDHQMPLDHETQLQAQQSKPLMDPQPFSPNMHPHISSPLPPNPRFMPQPMGPMNQNMETKDSSETPVSIPGSTQQEPANLMRPESDVDGASIAGGAGISSPAGTGGSSGTGGSGRPSAEPASRPAQPSNAKTEQATEVVKPRTTRTRRASRRTREHKLSTRDQKHRMLLQYILSINQELIITGSTSEEGSPEKSACVERLERNIIFLKNTLHRIQTPASPNRPANKSMLSPILKPIKEIPSLDEVFVLLDDLLRENPFLGT